uniref:Protein amnionless n=1 Tax=Strongyloides venezuelensis TaxID=75913 RepID=A0A0K0FEN0_STRVS
MCEDDAIVHIEFLSIFKELETQSKFDKFYETKEGYFQWEWVDEEVLLSNDLELLMLSDNGNINDKINTELVIERNSNLDDEYMKEICSFIKCEEDHEMDCWNPINVEGHCCKLCGQAIEFEIDKTNSVNQFMYFADIKINQIKKIYNSSHGISFTRLTPTPTIKPTYQLVVFKINDSLTYSKDMVDYIMNKTIPIFNILSKSEINITNKKASNNILFWSSKKKILIIMLFLVVLTIYLVMKFSLIEKLKNFIRCIFGYTSNEYFVIRYKNGNVNITGTHDETKCLLSKGEGC